MLSANKQLSSSFGKVRGSSKSVKGIAAKSLKVQVRDHQAKRLVNVQGAVVLNAKTNQILTDRSISYVESHKDGSITGNFEQYGKIVRVTLTHRTEVTKRKTIHGFVNQVTKSNPVWVYSA